MRITTIGIKIPAPLRRPVFRRLWLGMTTSYAGDRLQVLAQSWLVATLTGSALGVGLITAAGSIPLLLLPLGGAIVENLDRRRLLVVGQLVGATSTAVVATLVLTNLIAVWHIYAWAFVNGFVVLLSRPAYKVILTEAVPMTEVRTAVALNSTTETGSLVLMNAVGSLIIGALGLPIAFLLNFGSYLVAAFSLVGLSTVATPSTVSHRLAVSTVLADLVEGVAYLFKRPALLLPLAMTYAIMATVGPLIGILPAIVHLTGGTIVDLGFLSAALGVGSFAGAIYAGVHGDGDNPPRRYAIFSLVLALTVSAYAVAPVGLFALVPLVTLGFVAFAEAVWNTSRVRRLADTAYQARLQAFTSMVFSAGLIVGSLWSGAAVDRFGPSALIGGAVLLAAISLAAIAKVKPTLSVVEALAVVAVEPES